MSREKKKPNNTYLTGTPVEEIAKTLDISCTRVYQIQNRALRKIRLGLKQRGYELELIDLPGWLISDWFERFLKPQDAPK